MGEVVEKLKERFGAAVLAEEVSCGQQVVFISRESLPEVVRFLHDEMDFKHLPDLCGVDYKGYKPKRPVSERFEVVYNLYSISRRELLRLRVPVPEEDPRVPSVTSIFRVANWFERECYDMFGIRFEGHPDLRRLLMPEDWEGHPLRKDYPLEPEKEWPEYERLREKARELSRYEWGGRRVRGGEHGA